MAEQTIKGIKVGMLLSILRPLEGADNLYITVSDDGSVHIHTLECTPSVPATPSPIVPEPIPFWPTKEEEQPPTVILTSGMFLVQKELKVPLTMTELLEYLKAVAKNNGSIKGLTSTAVNRKVYCLRKERTDSILNEFVSFNKDVIEYYGKH